MNKGNFLLVMLGVLFVLFIFSPMFIFADYWVTKTYRPITGMTPGADTIDGIIYCMGGYRGVYVSENDAYNPATDTWTTKAPIPIGIYGFAMATVNGKIYIIGGRGDNGHTDSTRIYDSVTDTWTVGASMPTIRENCKAAVVNGKIYVIGGDINYSSVFSNNEMYDPIADTWTIKTPMPTGRFGPAIAVVDDKIYVIGGAMGNTSYTNKNEIYDPTTDIWATGDTISKSKRNCSAGVVDGKIYVIGGWNGSNLSDNDMYNPITDTWTPKTSMHIARNGLATAVVNNKIYAIGGYTGSYTGACEEYNLVYDIGVIAILYPDSGIVGAGYHHISGMVKNFGEISESFKVFTTVFDTTNGWSQIFADTVSVSSLAIQDSIVVDFDSVNFEEDKVYLTKIYVSLPDANITNDTMSVYSSTKHCKVMFVEDAEGYGAPYHPDSTWFIPLQNLLGDSIYWYGLTNDEYENGPSLAAMQHADLVIWNCYDYYNAASFTDYDTTNINDYIAGGGKIWLIGQDIVYSNTDKGKDKTRSRGTRTVWSWLTNNFGVDSVYEDYLEEYTMNIQGQNEIFGNIIHVVSDFDPGFDGYLYP
ncbi:hypothetical protein DRP43_04990, partial [candidate division TA06 bacterium]